ncbi:MAG TPA: ABC transporter substrate-binding protein [Gemmataceae bacterium]|nr:ABC transporter substrate-binding protein [Gemmataceae bacterium]
MRFSLLFAALLVVGCNRSDKDKPIEVGHIHPPGGDMGDEQRALRLAIDEWNKDTSKLPQGRRLVIRHAPGGAKPEEWGAQATRLLALNKSAALVGGDRGAFAERIGMAVQGENVVAISPAGWPGPTAGQNLVTVGLSPAERGRLLAKRAKEAKPKTVLVLRDPSARAANAAAERFMAECRAFTPPVAIRVAEVTDEQTPNGDVVFLACSARLAVRQRDFYKGSTFLFGDEDAELPALLAEGPAAEGFIVATAFNPDDKSDRFTAFAQRYQEAYQQPPSVSAVLAHDALSVWVEAARRADSLDAGPIREQLLKREQPYEILTGTLTFADDHTAQRPGFVGRIAGGRLADIKP